MKNKKNIVKKKRVNKEWPYYWTSLYCMLLFLPFPLYFWNNYINILEAKTAFFTVVTSVYVVIGAVMLLCLRQGKDTAYGNNKKKGYNDNRETVDGVDNRHQKGTALWMDLCCGVFAAAVLGSVLLAENKTNALWAYDGKQFGAVVIILCCGLYFVVSRGFRWNGAILWCVLVGVGLVFVLATINRYGADPIGMYDNLVKSQRDDFLSTIGQINIVSGFVCVFVPLFMGLFIYAKEMTSKVLYGIIVYFGVMAGVSANSDSFFVGEGLCFIGFLWFAMETKKDMLYYVILAIISVCAMISLKYMNGAISFDPSWRSLQKTAIENVPWIAILFILVVLAVLLHGMKKENYFTKARNVLFGVFAAVLIPLVFYVIYINTAKASVSDSLFLICDSWGGDSIFRINDSWGTNRGFVWSRTIELFGELPLQSKLFGLGSGGFTEFFMPYYEESIQRFGYYYMDAHNEFLQFLVTTGIVGVTSYYGMLLAAIINCIRKRTDMHKVLAVVFIVWIGQSMFNNPLVFTTPYLFLFMGINRAISVN